jgi:hypothetical protein
VRFPEKQMSYDTFEIGALIVAPPRESPTRGKSPYRAGHVGWTNPSLVVDGMPTPEDRRENNETSAAVTNTLGARDCGLLPTASWRSRLCLEEGRPEHRKGEENERPVGKK